MDISKGEVWYLADALFQSSLAGNMHICVSELFGIHLKICWVHMPLVPSSVQHLSGPSSAEMKWAMGILIV